LRRIGSLLLALFALALAAGAQAKTFVYVYDGSADKVDDPKIYAFESRGGLLSPVTGSPFDVPDAATDCTGQCMAIDYSKKRKTRVVSGPTGLSSFLVNKDGSLTLAPGSPFPGGELTGVATVQVGKRSFVYAANFDTTDLHGFEIGTDGVLTPLANSPFESGLDAPAGAIARKRFLFVADQPTEAPEATPPGLGVYVIGEDGTPAAAPGAPLDLPGLYSYNVGADAAGKFVYVGDDADAAGTDHPIRVNAVAIDKKTGAPTLVPGTPFDTDLVYEFQAGASVGKGIVAEIASDAVDDDLALFRPAKNGSLTQLGTGQDTNVNARAHTFGGKFLFVASTDNVVVIAIRKRDGAVDHAPFVPLGTGGTNPIGIVVLNR
jgi:hypothetical protein